MTQKRGDFRVIFPNFYRASLTFNSEVWPLIDLSASGVRARYKDGRKTPPPVGTSIKGKITLPAIGEFAVQGSVLRIEADGVVILKFISGKGIPAQEMMTVHRYIIQQSGSKTAS